MDPFQNKYGSRVAAVIFIPALIADVMWAACILGILGEYVFIYHFLDCRDVDHIFVP